MKKPKERFLFKNLLVMMLVVSIIMLFLFSEKQSWATTLLNKKSFPQKDFIREEIEVSANIPGANLPLTFSEITNFEDFSKKMPLEPRALEWLAKNAFVVIPTPLAIAEQEIYLESSQEVANPQDDFVAYYELLKNIDLPIFITSDSLLHYYHLFFDSTLMRLERDLFYEDMWVISQELLEAALKDYEKLEGDLKEAAWRNIAYLSVALELLKPEKSQIISEETLKEEYCPPEMEPEYCEMIIAGVKDIYGEKASYQYFSEAEGKRYQFETPEVVQELVQAEINLIDAHQGWEYSPLFIYQEDYSQYIPRGHYTKAKKLKNYFKALMWYGRMTALIEGSPSLSAGESACSGGIGGIISEYDARIQTLQAFLLAEKFISSQNIQERWNRIYSITSFMVGFSDDLGPWEYGEVLQQVFTKEKGKFSAERLTEKYKELKEIIGNYPYNPKIYSGLGACELLLPCPPLSEKDRQALKIQAKELLSQTKGFRLMGQKFTLDSWLFSEIVSPYSGEYNGPKLPLPTEEKPFTFSWDDDYEEFRNNRPFTWVKTEVVACPPPAEREVRGFPRGLDLMALLGSERALEILENSGDTQYSDYEKIFSPLKNQIDSFKPEDWFSNLYLNWLYVLQSLHGEFGEGYPTFMQTTAWQDKELNTTLASWAELRHDTILYVKQSYTMAEKGGIFKEPPVVGYVEPVPEFYARLLNLTRMTLEGFQELIPQQELEELMVEAGLNRFVDILTRLLAITQQELANQELGERDYDFIENFGSISANLIESISGGEVSPEALKTVLIADVHTEGNTKKVLEEGVGYLKTAVIAYKLPQGNIILGVGPVFSYYEFKQPMDERLTDEAWREILSSNPPDEPDWIRSFSE
ncbi:MAG: DUF3160 domain-containing protein [Candidatus Atribacteria bacterium]|nr:DUF3160 domain-containing protein [Candidatus Atribacteria bacterium]